MENSVTLVADLSVLTRTTSRLFCFPSLEQVLAISPPHQTNPSIASCTPNFL